MWFLSRKILSKNTKNFLKKGEVFKSIFKDVRIVWKLLSRRKLKELFLGIKNNRFLCHKKLRKDHNGQLFQDRILSSAFEDEFDVPKRKEKKRGIVNKKNANGWFSDRNEVTIKKRKRIRDRREPWETYRSINTLVNGSGWLQ